MEAKHMTLKDCQIGTLVKCLHRGRFGHIVGLTLNSSGEPIVMVRWAIIQERSNSPWFEESSIHPGNIEAI